ncbi:hypothetical protein BASA50_009616 [Batrachochytrium salamandrivorans]|uniref:Uncharacterized protein n=1 Tax=Batrachochytrium salamandrivorans TaxID=1357716 RepID=A0ABQ8F0V6_9FUNG|nr:hypothetical protein BASA50_009616 [Batrachochytrium salamandrivorans]
MRVDTGIILSVLSFSVIAAVIPNGDDHAPLLVRRAVSSENGAVLWKRNNDDDQMDSDDSDSDSDTDTGTSGSGSSSNSPSRSRGSSNPGSPQSAAMGAYTSPGKVFKSQRQRHTIRHDRASIQRVIKTLTQVTEGRYGNQVIAEIGMFLRVSLASAKKFGDIYDSEVKTPFAPPPQRSKNPESLARELTRIQSAANELVEKCLKRYL